MAQINTTCPKCGAPHSRKLSVIHAEGLSTVQTKIDTVGTFNTIGRQKITTKGTTNGTQQTQASKDAAPPVVPTLMTRGAKIQGIAIAIGIVMCVGGFINDSTSVAMCGVITILGAFAIPTKPTPEEQARHDGDTAHLQAAKDAWADTFQCSSCGERFVPAQIQAA